MEIFARLAALVVLCSAILCDSTLDWGTLNFCLVSTPSDRVLLQKQCNTLEKSTKNRIKCVFAVDRLRCLQFLMKGKADFGIFKAEDLLIGSVLNNETINDLVVTNEFQFLRDQRYEFEMVVVVTNLEEINSLADLRGKRLCHPGFDENGWMRNDWSEGFSQYFEDSVVAEECNPKLTVFENRIRSLSNFFGPSCKPGPWSPDPDVDYKLKSKYSNLCKKCSNSVSCSQKDVYWGRTGPVMCLTDCNGDVAWLRLEDLRSSFKIHQEMSCHNVSFLCPDGSKQSMDTVDPCTWISHPWPSIVSRKSIVDNLIKLINLVNISDEIYDPKTWQYLLRVLFNGSFQPLKIINPVEVLDYLKQIPGFYTSMQIPNCNGSGDDKSITICVTHNVTLNKCSLLANVARVYSIDPGFQCIVSNDCLDAVSNGTADVTIVSTAKLRKAYEMQTLKTILYQTHTDYSSLPHISAVVKINSTLRHLRDLRGKQACFIEENGFSWNSLVMALKDERLIQDDCDNEAVISKFFSNVCIIDSKPGDSFPSCFPDDEIKPSGGSEVYEALGLRCLTEGGGDVAFIDENALGKYLPDDFVSICLFEYEIMYDCYLSWASFGQILSRKNLTRQREEEILSAFSVVNSLFGDDNPGSTTPSIFKLFSHDTTEKNMLFQSAATRLERPEKFWKRGMNKPNNYEIKLKDTVSRCLSKNNTIKNLEKNKSVISFPVIEFYVFQIIFIFYIAKNFVGL